MNIKLLSALGALFLATSCAITDGKETTKQYVKDSAITMHVKNAFASDKRLKAREIHVETLKGAVQLSGFVSSKEEASRAEDRALKISGVKTVHNSLVVQPRAAGQKSFKTAAVETVGDANITSKIKLALMAEKDLKSTGVKVVTNEGNVTLSGTVPSSEEATRAEDIAKSTDGVREVFNKIIVS